MAMAHELPFDGEGRIVLPAKLAETAQISDRATFVGRGPRFQIWSPENYDEHERAALVALREQLANGGGLR
jgi:MraZ protein